MDATPSCSFDTYADYRRAALEALSAAQHTVAIFDPDLAKCGLESPAALERLERFCIDARRDDALRILLFDGTHLERHCPRLVTLLVRYAHRASVRIADADAHRAPRPFLLVDDTHLVSRFHRDLPRGRRELGAGSGIACFATQFDTLWPRGQALALQVALGI